MIEIKNYSIKYGNDVICSNINLNINDGDYIAIVGANGSGKTSLLNSIFNKLNISKNKILIDGIDTTEYKDWSKFGYVSQNYNLSHDIPLNVKEYLNLYFKDKKKLDKLAREFEVEELFNKKFNDLSGGQKQRVNIVKSLSKDIKYLILDEPNSGLDQKKKDSLYSKLHKLNQKGLTIIVVTHDILELKKRVHKIYDMNLGLSLGEVDDCKYC